MDRTTHRRRRSPRRHSALTTDMLPFTERKLAQDLEIKHGVIVNAQQDGLTARHWKTDEVLAEADDIYEMQVVLRSMHIYIDPNED